ncbi:hypothetical protein TrST_g6558 [Triparma strigata]|uniref:Calmodulin n=1 Tax=Triparma strigata TaxID=1606541 RepID=A0A9W7ATK9_9STRA|nr:hypothetical protein TrST_g6558 [Triparma strigata]
MSTPNPTSHQKQNNQHQDLNLSPISKASSRVKFQTVEVSAPDSGSLLPSISRPSARAKAKVQPVEGGEDRRGLFNKISSFKRPKSQSSSVKENPGVLSFRDRKVIRDAFNLFDVDGSGTVSREELTSVMETLFGEKVKEEEIKDMIKDVKVDEEGDISYEEFLKRVTIEMAAANSEKKEDLVRGSEKSSNRPLEKDRPKGEVEMKNRGRRDDNHWRKLGTLIKNFQDEHKKESINIHKNHGLHLFENQKKLEAEKRKVELSKQSSMKLNRPKSYQERLNAWKEHFSKPMEPDTKFRRSWDIMMMLLVIFQAMYIPYSVAWQINWGSEWHFDTIVDVLFITDLCMSFNLAYRPHPQADLVTDRKKIAKNYLKLWFWIDLVASVPFDKIAQALSTNDSQDANASSALGLLKGLRLPRLLRLLKIMRLLKVFRMAHVRPELMWWFQYSRHANLIRLFNLFFGMVILVHYIACIFMMVLGPGATGDEPNWFQLAECEFPDNTEVQIRALNSPPSMACLEFRDYYDQYFKDLPLANRVRSASEQRLGLTEAYVNGLIETYGLGALDSCYVDGDIFGSCSEADIEMSYTTAYYYSMLLIMGEEIRPGLVSEKWFATIIILAGSVIIAIIYGNVSMYIANYTANQTAYQRKMELLFESMNHLQLPQNLKKRILLYYDHIWKEYRTLDGTITYFIPELSKQLASEVYLYLRTNLILSVPFLRQCSPEVVQELVMRLKSEIFLPSDYIVHKGAPGNEMFLISKGICEVTVTDVVALKTPTRERSLGRKGRRRSSAILGAMENFTDFIQQRNLKLAEDREAELQPLQTEEGSKIPVHTQRKSYVAQMAPAATMKRLKLKTFRLADLSDVSGMKAAGANAFNRMTGSPKRADDSGGEDSGRESNGNGPEVTQRPKMRKEKVVKELLAGEYFGEICLILNTPRTCNVRAKTFCELTVLHRSDFDDVVLQFEDERKVLEEIIMEKYSNEASKWELQKRGMKKMDIGDLAVNQKETEKKTTQLLELLDKRLRNIEDGLAINMKQTKKVLKKTFYKAKREALQGSGTSPIVSGGRSVSSQLGGDDEDDGMESIENSPTDESRALFTAKAKSLRVENQAPGGMAPPAMAPPDYPPRGKEGGGKRLSDIMEKSTSGAGEGGIPVDGEDFDDGNSSSDSDDTDTQASERHRRGSRLSFDDFKGNPAKQLEVAIRSIEHQVSKLNDIIREIREKGMISDFHAARLKVLNNNISYLYNNVDAIGRDAGLGQYSTDMSKEKNKYLREIEELQRRVRELLDESAKKEHLNSRSERIGTLGGEEVIFQKSGPADGRRMG